MRNDIEHFEMELEWARSAFADLFQSDGEIIPETSWINLFSRSLTIIELEDKIFLLREDQ